MIFQTVNYQSSSTGEMLEDMTLQVKLEIREPVAHAIRLHSLKLLNLGSSSSMEERLLNYHHSSCSAAIT